MKKLLIILLILMTKEASLSQQVTTVCDENYTPVRTDPDNPYNENLPYDQNGQPNPNPPGNSYFFTPNFFLNGVRWNDQEFPLPGMFYNNIPQGVKSDLSHPSLGAYYNYIYETNNNQSHLHLPNEGWEILLSNVGFLPDGVTPAESHLFDGIPYIVLYNRYNGVIRVFVGMGPDTDISNSADALQVNLFFYDEQVNLSGLLRYYSGHDIALDKPTKFRSSVALAKAITEKSRWASTDFQVAYDPCSCKTPGKINLEFTWIKNQKLTLYGRSAGITDNDIMTNEMELNPKEFLSGFDISSNDNQANAGMVIEKSMEITIDQFLERYEKYQQDLAATQKRNEKVNKNLAILKFSKFAIATAGTIISGGLASPNLVAAASAAGVLHNAGVIASGVFNAWGTGSEDANWFKTAQKAIPGLIKDINGTVKKLDSDKLFGAMKKVFGEDVDNFISKNFEVEPEPAKPDSPTNSVTYTEMTFGGTIETKTEKTGPTFLFPGSYGENRSISQENFKFYTPKFSYPVYNDVLGVFALLNSPKVRLSKTVEDYRVVNDEYRINYNYPDESWKYNRSKYLSWTNSIQLTLDQDLKYSFNPVLDIKGTPKVQAAWSVKGKLENNNIRNNSPFTVSSSFVDPTFCTNIQSKNLNTSTYDVIFGFQDQIFNETINPYSRIDFVPPSGLFPEVAILSQKANTQIYETFSFSTHYVPIDAFRNLYGSFGVKNEFFHVHHDQEIKSRHPVYGIQFHPSATFWAGEPIFALSESLLGDKGITIEELEIELKLIIDIEFNTFKENGTTNKVTMMLTYKIDEQNSGEYTLVNQQLIPNLENSSLDFGAGEYLNLSNIVFDGNQVNGCSLNGTHYTCKAYNEVIIDGDLSTNWGYTVEVIAGNQVLVNPSSQITPEIILKVEPVLNLSNPMPAASATFLNNFCANKPNGNYPPYLAGISGRSSDLDSLNEPSDENFSERIADLRITLFPNPATNSATVQLSREAYGANVQVFDLMGRASNVAIRQDGLQFVMDLSNLVHGVYMVKISSAEGTETKSLIVK